MRVHRVVPGFIVQLGDPQIARPERSGSGGDAERRGQRHSRRHRRNLKKRLHVARRGRVAHPGNPREADSQIYITLDGAADLDGKYAVFGTGRSAGWMSLRTHPGDRRSSDESIREGVTGAFTTRALRASGYRSMNSGGYSPSIGSLSCCLIIAALATDFAAK